MKRRRRHAAGGLLWGMAFLLLSHGGLALACVVGRLELYDLVYQRKRDLYRTHLARCTDRTVDHVLLLGSSRTLVGCDPAVLNHQQLMIDDRPLDFFNFGIAAAGPKTLALYLHRLCRDGLRPNYVVLEILPPMLPLDSCGGFSDGSSTPEHQWLGPQRLKDDEEAGFIGLPTIETDDWIAGLFPIFQRRGAILHGTWSELAPPYYTIDASAWSDASGMMRIPNRVRSETDYSIGLRNAARQYPRTLRGFAPGNKAHADLRRLLELCRRQRLPCVLLLMPECPRFQQMYNPSGIDRFSRLLQDLIEEFQVPLIDARNWLDERSFIDGHHLHALGATRFTARLGAALPAALRAAREQHP